MSEEFDIHELANEAKKAPTAEQKNKKSLLRKVVLGVIVALVFIVGGGTMAYSFFAHTDFNEDVPLTSTVSQWNPLFLYYGETKGKLTNKYGEWVDLENTGVFTNEENGCFIRLIPTGSPNKKEGDDLKDTNNLISQFKNVENLGTAWLPMEDSQGQVEFNVITLEAEGDIERLGAFVRSFAKSGSNVVITIGCKDEALMKEILTEQAKDFDLGVTMTLDNRLS